MLSAPRRGPALILLLLGWAGISGAASLELEVVDYWVRALPATVPREVGVVLTASQESTAAVAIAAPRARVTADAALLPGVSRTLWLPLPAGPERFRITVAGAGLPPAEATVESVPARGRPPVVVGPRGGQGDTIEPLGSELLHPLPERFPHHPAAYAGIGTLLLEPDLLQVLDTDQLRALEGHLAACGRTLVRGFPGPLLALARTRAGCGGTALRALDAGTEIGAALEALERAPVSKLPSAAVLSALGGEQSVLPGLNGAVLLFLLYGLVLPVLLLGRRRTGWLLGIPVLFAGLLLGAATGAPRVAVSCWAEAVSGSTGARLAATFRVQGAGRGRVELTYPQRYGLPAASTRGAFHARVSADGDAPFRVEVFVPFLAERELTLRSAEPVELPVTLDLRDGSPVLHNLTAATIPTGLMAWGHRIFETPALAPGERWIPSGLEPDARSPGPAGRVLQEQALRGRVGFLLPHLPDWCGAVAPGTRGSGWLVVWAA